MYIPHYAVFALVALATISTVLFLVTAFWYYRALKTFKVARSVDRRNLLTSFAHILEKMHIRNMQQPKLKHLN